MALTFSIHPDLVWFNDMGDYLNFEYNDSVGRYEGDLMFPENSSDTFKTIGTYLFERIPAFTYQNPPYLSVRKFQLFNEFGFNFYGNKYQNEEIELIEPTNSEPNYFSKWIWGHNFEKKFPLGTILTFDQTIFEFTNLNQTYTVVGTKKNAVMIISFLDNQSFTSAYYTQYNNPSTFTGKTISGTNVIGVYDYINGITFAENLSQWNEKDFYGRYFNNRPLNLINTKKNNKVNLVDTSENEKSDIVNVDNENLIDNIHTEYQASYSDLPTNTSLIIELITKTDLDLLYDGSLNFSSTDNRIYVNPGIGVPKLLKPGREFKVVGSSFNTSFLHVDYIPTFLGNSQLTFYATYSQILWNNDIFECVLAYTQSSLTDITPDDATYWGPPSYIQTSETLSNELLLSSQIYLTTDHFYYEQTFTQSSEVTFACAAQSNQEEFGLFNIDLYYHDHKIRADLRYPSPYAEVNFYKGTASLPYKISSGINKYERIVSVDQTLVNETNMDYSSNFNYNVVFTRLDEYGIIIKINKEVYQQEAELVYIGGNIDMPRTIDKTLRNWIAHWNIKLSTLGILTSLAYVGVPPIFYNTVVLKTQYPNVPIKFTVQVGTTANYYIENSTLTFYDMGSYLNIKINNHSYGIGVATHSSMTQSFIPDIVNTLSDWVDTYYDIVEDYGIEVSQINQVLSFNVKKQSTPVNLVVNVGKSSLPGIDLYKIISKIQGNVGTIITSNEILIPEDNPNDFYGASFSTGQIVAINNTVYPYDNQEYDILYLNSYMMNLSYEGPFWGLTGVCISSPYVIVAFNSGFGQTGCSGSTWIPPIDLHNGAYSSDMFVDAYNIAFYNTSTYSVDVFGFGTTNMVDIKWLPGKLFALGDDITVVNSIDASFINTISLGGNTGSIALKYNPKNNLLYALAKDRMFAIDPVIETIIQTWSFTSQAYDISIVENPLSPNYGDVYVSYFDNSSINIWDYTNPLVPASILEVSNNLKMVYNDYYDQVYVTNDIETVIEIDSSNRLVSATYAISGLKPIIEYDPIQKSIYVFGSTLHQIIAGNTYSIPLSIGSTFSNLIYNPVTSTFDISSDDTSFTSMNYDNTFNFTTYIGNYGYQAVNEYDGDVYHSSVPQNSIYVLDSITGLAKFAVPLSSNSTKIIYDPDRQSIWSIQPAINQLVEIRVKVNSYVDLVPVTYSTASGSYYGTLDPNYVPLDHIWLNTKEHLRMPRENYVGDVEVEYYYRWFSDNVPQMFMYDLSGDQLYTDGAYAYTGPKPLPLYDENGDPNLYLNKYPNKDVLKVSDPTVQQTIFSTVSFALEYIDDTTDVSVTPEPLELFLGFNAPDEGAIRSILQLYKRERISLTILNNLNTDDIVTFDTVLTDTDYYGTITLDQNSTMLFTDVKFKKQQMIAIFVTDYTNTKRNQYISRNNALLVQIRSVNSRQIIVDFVDPTTDFFVKESSSVSDYPSVGQTTLLKVELKVWDKELARFTIYGQTEIEDERFSIELGNVGHGIGAEDAFIFKDYNIKEQGVDWNFLNRKRKELLMVKHDIFSYIGSYKAIINSINYFGYNDLQMYEYYRNIDSVSPLFGQLFKTEIPDIFTPGVKHWNESDFLKFSMPNPFYEDTNLFNLTYLITDKEGNNLLHYSVKEAQIKLQGLKYWLQDNVIPITHKILDITGRADMVSKNTVTHIQRKVNVINQTQNLTPIGFELDEAYLMPVNSGSTVYNCVLDFNTQTQSYVPDYYTIDIRTYKTYKEWNPWTTYQVSDLVSYYGKIFESQEDNNRINNPFKYSDSPKWVSGTIYKVADIVLYDRNVYSYTALGTTASATYSGTASFLGTASVYSPVVDVSNWQKINFWKEIDLQPVQTISEYRQGSNLLPYNFTLDSNLDPFVTINVISHNGYGAVYGNRKNYEIRGLKDLSGPIIYLDPIGPFIPITPVS